MNPKIQPSDIDVVMRWMNVFQIDNQAGEATAEKDVTIEDRPDPARLVEITTNVFLKSPTKSQSRVDRWRIFYNPYQ